MELPLETRQAEAICSGEVSADDDLPGYSEPVDDLPGYSEPDPQPAYQVSDLNISIVRYSDSATTTAATPTCHPAATSKNDTTPASTATSSSGCWIPSTLIKAGQISAAKEADSKWVQKEAKGASDRFVHTIGHKSSQERRNPGKC